MRVLASAVELGELEVVDWANSREDLVYLEHDAPLADILAVIRRHKYSRYPVWDSHKGEFIGLLHIKDLLLALSALDSLPETFDLDELVRPLEIVTKHTRCRACWSSSAGRRALRRGGRGRSQGGRLPDHGGRAGSAGR